MEKVLFYIILALGAICIGLILYGLFRTALGKRNDKNAQSLMRVRLILQAIALLLIVFLLIYANS